MNERLAKNGSNLRDRAFEFAVAAVELHRGVYRSDITLRDVSRQFVKAATSVGANLEEADAAQSRADFISKCTISLKEAREAHYWARLVARTAIEPAKTEAKLLVNEANQLVSILTTIVRRTRENDVIRDAPADDDLSILNSQFSILNSGYRMNAHLIDKAYIVPGLPHIYLAADKNRGWASLRDNYLRIAKEIEQSDAELMLVYSTQWFSVIGHLFQVDPKPAWTLVDANWYEYGEIPYELRVDAEFGRRYCETARRFGLQASTVNYKGFPVDSGTVVAMKFLNPDNRIPASVVSCNIYAERDETRVLGRAARVALEEHGKKAIVVVVSNFSNRFHTHEIDPAADAISSAKDDEWNRKLLEILADGRLEDTAQLARQFAREANADMGFKAIWWLSALLGETNQFTGKVWDYQPVWGTGAALVELTPATEPRVFEKEYDEVSISELGAAGDATSGKGTGLASHNLLEAEGDGQPAERAREGESATAPPKVTTTSTDKAPKPVGAYPHAKRVGDMLFLSGIGPRQAGSDEIPGVTRNDKGEIVDWDIEVQTRAVIENVKTILREAGSSLDKVVDVTVFLTNMKRDFAGYNKVYTEYFSSIQATRTTVGVDSLPTPIAVEFKILAMP